MPLLGARYPPQYVREMQGIQPRYDHSGLPGAQSEPDGTWTHYDTIILLHGLCGFIAWQIIAPIAVMVVALGKRKGWWFDIHWRLHIFLTAPLTVACVVLGTAASSMGDTGSRGKHQVLGFFVLACMWIQVALGYWSHLQHENAIYSVPTAAPLPLPKRRLSNYIHIILGLFLLLAGGLEVTWGFSAYTAHPIAKWITIMHWLLASLPPTIFTPVFFFRIYRRMKSGDSFLQAFFGSPSATTGGSRPTSKSPPKKLWLGDSSYMDEGKLSGRLSGRGDIEDGEGFQYGRGGGVDGRQRVSTTSTWEGVETREEYEAAVRASLELPSQTQAQVEGEPTEGEETTLLAPPATTLHGSSSPTRSESYNATPSRPISFDSILSAPATSGAMGDFDFLPRPPTPPAGMLDDSNPSLSRTPSSTPSIALRLPVPTLSLSIFPEVAKTVKMNFASPILSQYGNILWNQSQSTFQSMTSSPLQITPVAPLPFPGEAEAPAPTPATREVDAASPATNDGRSISATENGGGEGRPVQSPLEMTPTDEVAQSTVTEGVTESMAMSEVAGSTVSEDPDAERTVVSEDTSTVVSDDLSNVVSDILSLMDAYAVGPSEELQVPRERTLSEPLSSLSEMTGGTGESVETMNSGGGASVQSAGTGKWMSGRVG